MINKSKVNPVDGLTYIWIPPGQFMMGASPGDTEALDSEYPAHNVVVGGFWMCQTPITQEAYEKVMGVNPSYFKGARRPVENVSWHDAQQYCRKTGMRLPTEAEWEYAARAGSNGSRYAKLDDIAWYCDNSRDSTHDVAQKQPNAWGLYDMLGNVWEWIDGCYSKYGQDPVSNPKYPARESKVVRGGSWRNIPEYVRVSYRCSNEASRRLGNLGFRCAGNEIGSKS